MPPKEKRAGEQVRKWESGKSPTGSLSHFLTFNVLSLWIVLALAIGTALLFWPVRDFEFIHYDDQEYVTENYVVQHGLTWPGVKWAFRHVHSSNWHPLTWISHMMDCQFFGNDAGKHHLTNLFFHVLTTVLAFLVVKRLTGAMWRSGFVAALFAIHPLHVESVAWVSERKDVLCAFFWMLTMWAYCRFAEWQMANGKWQNEIQRSTSKEAGRIGRWVLSYFLALVFFAFGLLSKPMIVTLPLVLLLLDFWPLNRIQVSNFRVQTFGKLLLEKIPFLVLAAISCVVTFLAQKNTGAMRSLNDIPVTLRIENALVSCIVYLRQMVWPTDLAIFYPHPKTIPLWEPMGAILLIVTISALVIWQAKRRAYFAIGWFWYLGTLVPVIGLVQVGVQAHFDHYTYIPLLGIFVALTWGAADLLANVSKRHVILTAASVATLMACFVASSRQLQYWRNSKTLFSHALDVTTENFIAHQTLGTALANEEKNDEAERHFRDALRIRPRFPEAEQNLGNILLGKKKFDEALEHYKKAVEYRPEFANAYDSIGLLYVQQEKWADAITNFQQALAIDPLKSATHFNLGSAFLKAGRTDDALTSYEKALAIDPTIAEAHYQAALIFLGRKKMDSGIAHLKEAVRLKPGWLDAMGQLAWIWSTQPDAQFRNGPGAVELAQRAVAIRQRKEPRMLSVLAAAYAECGRFGEAVQTAEEARQLLAAQGQTEHAKAVEKKIALYRANRPYRQE